MSALDELSSDQKYAISKIIDGIIIMIEELYYIESRAASIAAVVVAYLEEYDLTYIDEVIEELKKYKEEQP